MTSLTLIAIAASVFVTAVISGVFGMAGGLILMTILLNLMSLQAAMVVHASIQMVSNGWRCFLWRKHIVWHVLPFYIAGMVAGLIIIAFIKYVPDKAVALIAMGSLPLLAMIAGKNLTLSITNRAQTFFAAACLTFIQMTAGVVGPLLDLLYNNAPLTRQQIVSTKAFTQTTMHGVRLAYFGTLVPLLTGVSQWPEGLKPEIMLLFMAMAIAGTSAAAVALHRLSDHGFKKASRVLIAIISLYCLGQGFYLLLTT